MRKPRPRCSSSPVPETMALPNRRPKLLGHANRSRADFSYRTKSAQLLAFSALGRKVISGPAAGAELFALRQVARARLTQSSRRCTLATHIAWAQSCAKTSSRCATFNMDSLPTGFQFDSTPFHARKHNQEPRASRARPRALPRVRASGDVRPRLRRWLERASVVLLAPRPESLVFLRARSGTHCQ